MVSAKDIKDYFNVTADITKSVAADVRSLRETFGYDGYSVPRKDAQAINAVAAGGAVEKNRASNAAASASSQALKTGSMDFDGLFSGKNSGLVTLAIVGVACLVLWKMVK